MTFLKRLSIPLLLQLSLSQFPSHNQIPAIYIIYAFDQKLESMPPNEENSLSDQHRVNYTGKFVKVDVPQYLIAAKS